MLVYILVLLLIAAILGILGAVLKFAITVILGLMLAGAILAVGVAWWLRRRFAWARSEMERRLPDR
jgi:heme A synthase